MMRGLMKRNLIALLVGLALWQASPWVGAVPQQLRYQGVLTDRTGKALNGRFNLTFRIYTVATGGTPLWTETQPNMPIERGLFGVTLGSVTPLNLPFDVPYWLSIEVGTDGEMLPRQPVTAAPTAIRTTTAEALAPGALAPLYIVGNNVGIGTQTPTATLDVVGTAQMTGFRLPTGAQAGYVLTSDATGTGSWQAGGGGGNSGWIREGTVVRLTTATDNVGIGTTGPDRRLVVQEGATGERQLFLKQNNANHGYTLGASANDGDLSFARRVDATETETVRFKVNGNVGIGTASPVAKLHVAGDAQIDGTVRGATFGFGGAYQTFYSGGCPAASCRVPNPATGTCSCPAGFGAIQVSASVAGAGDQCGFVCFR